MDIFNTKIEFNKRTLIHGLIVALLFNTAIALFFYVINSESDFKNQFIISQSIGLSIFVSFIVLSKAIELKRWKLIIPLLVGSVVGVLIVITISAINLNMGYEEVVSKITQNYSGVLTTLFTAGFFGIVVLIFILSHEKIFQIRSNLQEEKIHNLGHQKKLAETNLRLIQAQIEPHFLFNSLSNVISLIETDATKSKALLESLTSFLRATLKRSADEVQTLEDEIVLIRNYLDIFKIRMGERLKYNIEHDDAIDCLFPPLLLQPLVENAIIHGIEPKEKGGEINIKIRQVNKLLTISVTDNGSGFKNDISKGFGLTNVFERIKSYYSNKGQLRIEKNDQGGVTATIEVPCEKIEKI